MQKETRLMRHATDPSALLGFGESLGDGLFAVGLDDVDTATAHGFVQDTKANDEREKGKRPPTFEEYVAAGYIAENYPPKGYAEVDSPGLQAFKAQKAEAQAKADADAKAKADAEAAAQAEAEAAAAAAAEKAAAKTAKASAKKDE